MTSGSRPKPMRLGAAALAGVAGVALAHAAAAQPGAPPAAGPTAPSHGGPPEWPKVDQVAGPILEKATITARGAQAIVDSAVNAAIRDHKKIAIGIVDDGGNLVMFYRMDGVSLGTINAVLTKAHSALKVEQPTGLFASDLRLEVAFASQGITVLNGGEPIKKNGKVVGALAVSGGSPEDDDKYIHAGMAAWAP